MNCPRCRLVNPDGAERCDCGYQFRSGAIGTPRREALPRECVELAADSPIEQGALAAVLQKRFPDCLVSEQDEGKGIVLGSPLRRCRWGLFVRRHKLLRGVFISHVQEITWLGRPTRPPYLQVTADSAFKHVPHGLFGVARLAVAAGEGQDGELKSELLEYLRSELTSDLRAQHAKATARTQGSA
jgi:hypothetical protein